MIQLSDGANKAVVISFIRNTRKVKLNKNSENRIQKHFIEIFHETVTCRQK